MGDEDLPPLDERVSETEDEVCVCYRINLPEYTAEDVKIQTLHEAATPMDEPHDPLLAYVPLGTPRVPPPYNTVGISVVASNQIEGTPKTQTLLFELRLPPQAKKTDQIRAFWREDRHQVVIIVQKEGKELVFRGLIRQYTNPAAHCPLRRPVVPRHRPNSGSEHNGSLDSLPT